MNKSVIKSILAASTTFMISGCMTGSDYQREISQVPETWSSTLPPSDESALKDLSAWWLTFEDPTLNALIQRAASDNLDIKIAMARIEEGQALLGIARGELLPSVEASGGIAATRLSDLQGGATAPDRTPQISAVGLDATWEVDLWGRLRRSVEVSEAGLQATIEDYQNTLVILYAQIANTYLSLRELNYRIVLADGNVRRQKETLELSSGRFDVGLVPELDVNQSKVNLARTESILPALRTQAEAALNRLAVLVGAAPGEIHGMIPPSDDVPLPELNLYAGLPATILRQRPDIRTVEQTLIAETARLGVRKADLLPRFSLSGSFALEASDVGDLSSSGSQRYSFGPSVSWAIFQGGRLRSAVAAQESVVDQLVYQYQQAVLLALEDVENAFVSYHNETIRYQALIRSVEAARKTVEQVRSLYQNGLVDFLNVLDAERSLASQEDEMAQSLGALSRSVVSVYRSLGGGWEAPEEDPFEVETSEEPETARATLSTHRTRAALEGIVYQTCMGRTARCPDRCGHSGNVAQFRILEYVAYEKTGEYGDPIADSFKVQIDNSLGQTLVSDEQHEILENASKGDVFNLSWKHDYVTRGGSSYPERAITELEPND